MKNRQRFSWGTAKMQELLILYPNTKTVYDAGRRVINTYQNHYLIYPQTNAVILDMHSNAWGPQEIDFSSASCNQAGNAWTRMPSTTYYSRKVVDGCLITLDRNPRITH